MESQKVITILSAILVLSIAGHVYQYTTNSKLNKQVATMQSDIASQEAELSALAEQISDLQLTIDSYAHQKEKYWTLAVDNYKISLQDGLVENTLDLMYYKDYEIDLERLEMSDFIK